MVVYDDAARIRTTSASTQSHINEYTDLCNTHHRSNKYTSTPPINKYTTARSFGCLDQPAQSRVRHRGYVRCCQLSKQESVLGCR